MTVDEMISTAKLEMVRDFLLKYGYTGLVCTDKKCGCRLSDIGQWCHQDDIGDCEPGYVKWCADCDRNDINDCEFPGLDYCISLKKEE